MHRRTIKAKKRWAKALFKNPDVNLVAVGYKQSGGQVTDVESIVVGVKKSGRTTGFKRGTVSSVSASVRVQYGKGKTALLEDQVTIEPGGFSAGGDSGSAILTEDNRLGGLLFAGSEQITIANRIEHVFRLLKLSL